MELKEKTIKGFLWTGTGKAVEQGITWIISILLARLLSPNDYGLMAITSIFIFFINYLNEFSMGAAIIQRKDLDETCLNSIFWFIFAMSILSYSITYIFSNTIASFFNQEKLADILKIAGLSFMIMAIGVVPSCLILRDLKFNLSTKINFVSNISMGIVSMVLAYWGFGVWSLVFGFIMKSMSFSALSFYFCSWKPKFLFSFNKFRQLMKFGFPYTVSKSLHALYYNSDNFIIGKFLGEKLLGYYYMAFHLATMPIDKLSRIINDVNFPVLSKLQHNNDKARNHLLKTSKYISIIIMPLLIGMILVADDFINVVLGKKWIPIIYPLKLFCVIGILRTINSTIPPLLIAKGRTDLNLKYSILSAIFLPTGFLIGVQFGINGVVYAWIIIYPFLTVYLLRLGLREISLPFKEYIKNLAPAIKASTFMATAVILFQLIKLDNKILRLCGSILIGFLSYTTFITIMHKEIIQETRNIIYSLKTKKVVV